MVMRRRGVSLRWKEGSGKTWLGLLKSASVCFAHLTAACGTGDDSRKLPSPLLPWPRFCPKGLPLSLTVDSQVCLDPASSLPGAVRTHTVARPHSGRAQALLTAFRPIVVKAPVRLSARASAAPVRLGVLLPRTHAPLAVLLFVPSRASQGMALDPATRRNALVVDHSALLDRCAAPLPHLDQAPGCAPLTAP